MTIDEMLSGRKGFTLMADKDEDYWDVEYDAMIELVEEYEKKIERLRKTLEAVAARLVLKETEQRDQQKT